MLNLQNSGQVLDDEDDGKADDAVRDGEAFRHPIFHVLGQLRAAGAHHKVLFRKQSIFSLCLGLIVSCFSLNSNDLNSDPITSLSITVYNYENKVKRPALLALVVGETTQVVLNFSILKN